MLAQTSSSYINDGVVTFPPQVDATNFINRGSFYVTNSFLTTPYYTYNTLNFTNQSLMRGSVGFRFDTSPSGNGVAKRAANFVNANLVNGVTATVFGGQRVAVNATNVINKGLLEVGSSNVFFANGIDGLMTINGDSIDLTRGTIRADGFEDTNEVIFSFQFRPPTGMFDDYWGTGSDKFSFGNFSPVTPQSGLYEATNLVDGIYNIFFDSLALTNSVQVKMFGIGTGPNTNAFQVVFLSNSNSLVSTDIGFVLGGYPEIMWSNVVVDAGTGLATTNLLFLLDEFRSSPFLDVVEHPSVNPLSPNPTFQPFNYSFSRADNFFWPTRQQDNVVYDPFYLSNFSPNIPRSWSAYGVKLAPTTLLAPTNLVASASVSNMPGRIEITADQQLNLTRTRIDGLNYLSLKSTNQFIGSPNANITSPYSDLNLASTNGSLSISNVLRPFVPRFSGDIRLWSQRWTNKITIGNETFYDEFSVLMVDSRINPQTAAFVKNLYLKCTNKVSSSALNNIFISDVLNVQESLQVLGEKMTITSGGALRILGPQITWTPSFPLLKYLTNSGELTMYNSAYFAGARRAPFFGSSYDEPYEVFVNRGQLQSASADIWAKTYENTGTNVAVNGPLTISAISGVVTGYVNAAMLGAAGDLAFSGNFLIVSNALMNVGRKVALSVTNQLTDGLVSWVSGANASNTIVCNDGFDLPFKPTTGDLLGTVVTNIAYAGVQVINSWAAQDRGANGSGFSNNIAIGRLVLDGGVDSQFRFQGVGTANAIYVDYLELKNYATNFFEIDPSIAALDIATNMVIYFANANIPPEKLQTRPDGRLRWVSSFAGPNSSSTYIYPSGTTYTFNAGLVASCTLDSDGDGVPNCQDPTPLFTADNMAFALSMNNQTHIASFSWNSLANATNYIEYKTNLASPTWLIYTNFISGPANSAVSIPVPTGNGSQFYRLRIAPPQP